MVKVFVVTALGCVGFLALSVWPGELHDTLFGFPWSTLLCLVIIGWSLLLIVLTIRERIRKPIPPAKRQRWGIWCVVAILATMALYQFHVPQLVTFACCSAEFRRLADAALADNVQGVGLPRRIGPYWVDQYVTDRSGGVYFRTGIVSRGAPFSDRPGSVGFAFRPSKEERARARYQHLYGDCYVY